MMDQDMLSFDGLQHVERCLCTKDLSSLRCCCKFFSKISSIFNIFSIKSTGYILNGDIFKQSKGIAMGNNAAPPLAIIYMHDLEEKFAKDPQALFSGKDTLTIFSLYTRETVKSL